MDIEAVGAKGLSCPVGLDLKAQSLQILYQPLSHGLLILCFTVDLDVL